MEIKTLRLLVALLVWYTNCFAQTGWTPPSGGASGGTWGTVTGNLSDQSDLQSVLNAKQELIGTITNDSAQAGVVGQYVSSLVASGSAVSLTTATTANVTSISLTAGDWDVNGNVNFVGVAATSTVTVSGVTSTSATVPSDGSEVNSGVTIASGTDGVTLPRKRFSISVTTTVYLVGRMVFSAGTVSAYGAITARRVR